MPNPELDRHSLQNALATPLIFLPGQTSEERLIGAQQMIQRSLCLQAVLKGRLVSIPNRELDAFPRRDGARGPQGAPGFNP